MITVTRKSHFSGITRERDIDVTDEQLARWAAGEMIQVVMPDVSREDREFIMTGITPEEWDDMFPPEREFDDGEYMECPYCKEIALALDGGECNECYQESWL